ncbi:DUF6582 domain-containing protein [Streptomyces sp. ME18-1-4]|uniref:DUF6582 domain-containing protein n=1 Tax=Streptomyces sp. ME18-1-4 TaxID=3028685 RepID=UPI0029BBB26F|nr:DUF6582 domain-containing protein [Streptomyces sp. ME18-1-4]MDX3245834.1 hypothetical protein [Streptomyces sp. ME18-1-4]
MAKAIATIEGTALVPGISRNGRRYSKEAIASAVGRLAERIADGVNPAVMLTSHGADDDSRCIVGRLTSVQLAEDGSARFAAQLADTDEGRKIAALVDTRNGPAFLKGVSIRGAWIGKVRRGVDADGTSYEEAPDLEIDGLDFTRKPGVPGAQIDSFTPEAASAPAENAPDGRVLITESVQEALVTTTTEADTPAVSKRGSGLAGDGVKYADPGYQSDKKQRYDITTKAKAKTAWSYISQADNARLYTSAQLKRIKQRIVKALKGFGVTVAAQEGWLIEPASAVTETLAECWGMDSADAGNLYVSLTNGPTTVTVSSYSLDPHDLDAVGRAAMAGAVQAIVGIDPDLDGDIDVAGEPGDDTATATAAGAPCPCGCGCAVPETPGECPCACGAGDCLHCMGEDDDSDGGDAMETAPTQTPAPETPAADHTQEKEPAMAESTTPAAETAAVPAAGGVHLTDEQFAQLLARVAPPAVPAVESAPAEPVAETQAAAPAVEVAETDEQRIARLVAEGVKAALPQAIQEHVEATGGPSRKGIVPQITESSGEATATQGLPEGAPDKPLHEYTPEEWSKHIAPTVTGAIFQGRG